MSIRGLNKIQNTILDFVQNEVPNTLKLELIAFLELAQIWISNSLGGVLCGGVDEVSEILVLWNRLLGDYGIELDQLNFLEELWLVGRQPSEFLCRFEISVPRQKFSRKAWDLAIFCNACYVEISPIHESYLLALCDSICVLYFNVDFVRLIDSFHS